MLRELSLHQHFAGPARAPGATGHLHDGLRQPLGGSEVGAEQALVGIEHAHQRDIGEVMTLGQHLRADQDARFAAVDPGDGRLQVGGIAHAVAVKAGDGQARKTRRQGFFDALGAMAQRPHPVAAARAGGGQRLVGAAVVAAEALLLLVDGQPRIAVPAGRDPAAAAAQQRGRIAAAVDEDQHLRSGRQMPLHGLQQRHRKTPVHGVAAQVDQLQRRRLGGAGAARQRQALRAAGSHVVQRFEGRRGRAQQHRHGTALRPDHRHVARRIAKAAFLLFERRVVLFIDHDDAQRRQRHEHRRAGADDDARPAAGRAAPSLQPLAVGQARVQGDQRHGKAFAKTRQQLRRQADLRAQHQRAAALCQHGVDQPQIHLGLAAAGHAIQQKAAIAAQPVLQSGEGVLLIV